jgi:hypothetical protein
MNGVGLKPSAFKTSVSQLGITLAPQFRTLGSHAKKRGTMAVELEGSPLVILHND